MNSALQCLSHIGPFVEIILNLEEQQPYQLPSIVSAYRRLLIEMQSIPTGVTSAYELKVCISELNRRFAGTNQQDSHEFLTLFIEGLHDELMDNYHNSSIGDLMHGTIRSTVKCLICKTETKTDDSFLSLPLPVRQPPSENAGNNLITKISDKLMSPLRHVLQNDITLYDCIDDFLKKEQLGANGRWFCEKCQKDTDAIKKLDLYELPKVLILQLKRFTDDLTDETKTTTKIRILKFLDLTRFVENNYTDQSAAYNLIAIMTHIGTLASGHCTTFARHLITMDWYHFNDEHVHQVSLNEALKSDAYILIYERQKLRSNS
ncbi:unnamed protein product [Rotaria sp. Silwood2]|nr:unnamed protein product [Rotaria sp. Silwood2]CAF2990655.1 unnamed protein product [Rotaria sp. Silwood2]CAF3356084.1 unnamed protein product [Rotaria sp. Silwood2]CAF4201258.1 unnamed protein product [Rotaria sp. Silwood2]CAF4302657.1 unnamed protein product [Rotaria sp. Silwood2]